MIELVGTARSRAFRPLWVLEELGMEFTHHADFPRSERALATHPRGTIPVMLEDGRAIADSTAIITYLADREGKLTAPAGTPERAEQDAITGFALCEMDGLLWTAARHSFVLPEERRVPEVKETLRWQWARSMEHLTDVLGDKPYLTGDALRLPDIVAVHCLGWAERASFPELPAPIAAYAGRARARPAFQRAFARD